MNWRDQYKVGDTIIVLFRGKREVCKVVPSRWTGVISTAEGDNWGHENSIRLYCEKCHSTKCLTLREIDK